MAFATATPEIVRGPFRRCIWLVSVLPWPWWRKVWVAYRASRLATHDAQRNYILAQLKTHR